MGGWGSWAPVTAESSARPPPLVTPGSPAPTPYGPREHKALPAGSLERHWFGNRPLAHYAAAPHPLVGFPCPSAGRVARGGLWTHPSVCALYSSGARVTPGGGGAQGLGPGVCQPAPSRYHPHRPPWPRGQGGVTWSAPGWSPDSPQERCWPSAGARPACSGRLAASRPWTWSATASAASSSSRGGFWKESGFRQRHSAGSEGALGALHGTIQQFHPPFYTH